MTTFEKMLINMYSGGAPCGWNEGKHTKGWIKSKTWKNTQRARKRAVKIAKKVNRPNK